VLEGYTDSKNLLTKVENWEILTEEELFEFRNTVYAQVTDCFTYMRSVISDMRRHRKKNTYTYLLTRINAVLLIAGNDTVPISA